MSWHLGVWRKKVFLFKITWVFGLKKYIYTKFTSAWREKSPESLSTFRAFIIFLNCDVYYLKLKHHTNVQTVNHCTWCTINLYSVITIFAHAIDSMTIE